MPFSVSLFLFQWAVGGLLFCWVTTRHRIVGLGYGWMLRSTFGVLAVGSFIADRMTYRSSILGAAALVIALSSFLACLESLRRSKAGVSGQKSLAASRSSRVATMTGVDRIAKEKDIDEVEFDPSYDLIAPVVGLLALFVLGIQESESWLLIARVLSGAVFLGVVTDAMLLGHWYLVQPGLRREPLKELVYWIIFLSIPEIGLFLLPEGMISVFTGAIDDGYGGLLGWFWIACAVTTLLLLAMTVAALQEKQYAAVMAATGLLYLAILTAFGIDLVARALLI